MIDGGGSTPDAKLADAGTSTTPDARVSTPDAGTASTPDAGGGGGQPDAGQTGPTPDARVCPVTVCTTTSGSVCSADGHSTITCGQDAAGCPTDTVAACGEGLTCQASGTTATCACPADTPANAAVAGTGCSTSGGSVVCSVNDDNGLSNELTCNSNGLGGCAVWETFGGAGGEGDCAAQGTTCQPNTHACGCPANTGSNFFANPIPDRTQLNAHRIATTGVQNPPVCAFETIGTAVQAANTLVNGSANRAAVVLSGGTLQQPAFFNKENPELWPLHIANHVTMTVDTDTKISGIVPPKDSTGALVPFDPRLNVVVFAPLAGASPTAAVILDGGSGGSNEGGQVYGFTIAGGPCVNPGDGSLVDCNLAVPALLMEGAGSDASVVDGPRARVSSMWLEGGGGNILATSAAFGPATATIDGHTVTVTVTTDDTHPIGSVDFITIQDLTFPGVFGPLTVNNTTGNTYTLSFFTNATTVPATINNWAVQNQGPLNKGLVAVNSAGSIAHTVAVNFRNQDNSGRDSSAIGFDFQSPAGAAGYTVDGLYAFNNNTGVAVESGLVTFTGNPLGSGALVFPGLAGPTVDHSGAVGVQIGLNQLTKLPAPAGDGRVVATNLQVINTTGLSGGNDFGSDVGSGIEIDGQGSAALTTAGVSGNAHDGAIVRSIGVDNLTLADSGSTYTANANGVEIFQGNSTFTGSHLDGNVVTGGDSDGVGLQVSANGSFNGSDTTVTVTGGTIASNTVGINSNGSLATVNTTGSATVSDNQLWGLLAGSGTYNIDTTLFTRNGVGNGDLISCDDSSNPLHMAAIAIGGSATIHLTSANVSLNHGTGIELASNGTITQTSVETNGGPTACDEEFDGIDVQEGGVFTFAGATSTANTNTNFGIHVEGGGTILSTAGGGLQANTNGFSGIQNDDGGNTTITVAAQMNGNCNAGTPNAFCAGVTNNGALSLANVAVTGNHGHGVASITGSAVSIVGSTIDSNSPGNGVFSQSTSTLVLNNSHITNNSLSGVNVQETATGGNDFANDDPINAWGAALLSDTITGNAIGVTVGSASQPGNITVLLRNDQIGLNNGLGVVATGAATDGKRTGISLVGNEIEQNTAAGLSVTSAYIKNATLDGSQFFPGVSGNTIAHNGFATSDTTCTTAESSSQVVFAGTDPAPTTSTDCHATFTTEALCSGADAIAAHCVFVSATTGCQRGYQLNGIGDCNQANTISGYLAHFNTQSTGPNLAGVHAVATGGALGPAFVNARNNSWATTPPKAQADYWVDGGAAIVAPQSCSPAANGGCILFAP